MAGLLPIMWGTGTGSEVMSRIAAPMVGGMISSTVLTLAVIPAIYALVKQWRLKRGMEGLKKAASECWRQEAALKNQAENFYWFNGAKFHRHIFCLDCQ